jgi:hypothetical protein
VPVLGGPGTWGWVLTFLGLAVILIPAVGLFRYALRGVRDGWTRAALLTLALALGLMTLVVLLALLG